MLQQQLTHEDFTEELAYMRLEPWPEEQILFYLAQIALMIAETNRDRKKKPLPFKLEQFMFDWLKVWDSNHEPQGPITEDRIEEIFRAIVEAQSGAHSGNNSKPSSED